jgi:hypothetical protein
MGTSLGGLHALETVLGALPAEFLVPVVVVQHRNKNSDSTLTELLRRHTDLSVHDAEDKMPLEPGAVYIGPPNYHTLVEDGYIALSCDGPVHYARPSIDVLFESRNNDRGQQRRRQWDRGDKEAGRRCYSAGPRHSRGAHNARSSHSRRQGGFRIAPRSHRPQPGGSLREWNAKDRSELKVEYEGVYAQSRMTPLPV